MIPQWTDWVRQLFIPSMTVSGDFFNPQLARVHSVEQTDGLSFALQFQTTSMENINTWLHHYGNELQKVCSGRFQGNVLFFTTTLEIIH